MSSVKKTIEIIVSPTGATTIQTHGFQGATCRDASRFIEQALGPKTSEQLTSEFYQASAVVEEQQRA